MNAPTVLNAAKEQAREDRKAGRKGKDKDGGKRGQFSPYAKALDAPKGLPRAQKERAGKSRTFGS